MSDINQLVDDFEFLTDWEDRYRHLIELGKQLGPLLPEEYADANKVSGCMSQVWLVAERRDDGHYVFRADSDAHIVKGLIAVLLLAYSNRTAEEIRAVDIEALFGRLSLQEHLSPNRRNGFFSMVGKIRALSAP